MNRLSRAVQNQFNDKKEREDIANLTLISKKVYFELRGKGMSHKEALREVLLKDGTN